ncbi:MAG TPA: DUF2244 domain-containing protein [Steroidobacteraceae bacterium]|nr:DUF2244 domain-containing protein [Steroidobacteraceae bacterium]HRX88366.1 DUF2244 domain-containing protein [Steroidobacteraceae bacterium]
MAEGSHRIVLAPHCSMSVRGATIFFALMCGSSFGVAGVVAAQGFWPVLPFAGLEMALLGWALFHSMQRRRQRQTILISDDSVTIADGERECPVAVFQRHWTRVKVRRASSRLHPSSLLIESQGKACEIGVFLTEEERRRVALQLGALIGRMNDAPAMPRGELV